MFRVISLQRTRSFQSVSSLAVLFFSILAIAEIQHIFTSDKLRVRVLFTWWSSKLAKMGEASGHIPTPKPIDLSATNLSHEFRRWKDLTNLYLKTLEFKKAEAKAATILYLAGPRMVEIAQQFIYGTDESPDEPDHVMAKIEAYCNPKKNETLERNRFWKAEFEGSFEEFLSNITRLADTCGFKDKDEMIRDKIVFSAPSKLLKSLLKENKLTLHSAINICRTISEAEKQANEFQGNVRDTTNKLCYVQQPRSRKFKVRNRGDSRPTSSGQQKGSCGRCGRSHPPGLENCKAMGKICRKCGFKDHFENFCRSRRVRNVEFYPSSDSSSDDTTCSTKNEHGKHSNDLTAKFIINNNDVRFIVDTGASINTINAKYVKNSQISPTHKKLVMWNDSNLRPIGQTILTLTNPANNTSHRVHFIVVPNNLQCLLGFSTIKRLNLISVNQENFIANVTSSPKNDKIREENSPDNHKKLGDLGVAKLCVDPNIQPRVLPCRTIPWSREEKVKQKLLDMISGNILKVVEEPTDWVSQMTAVEKPDGSIRVCLDPIPLNKALKREHFKLPTLEDILPKLHGARLFCKVDVSQAYLHVRLDEESSFLTTMATPLGRLRWLRLAYGLKPAGEIFQKKTLASFRGLGGHMCHSR